MARVRGASAAKEMRKRAGGGKFLTLSDGDEVEVAFVGVLKHGLDEDDDPLAEPFGIEVVWVNGRNGRYSIEYDPKQHDEDDMRVSFSWNVLVRGEAEDGSEDELKIFQQGPLFFDQFIRHKDRKGYGYWFTISRDGSGQFDTRYSLDKEDKIDSAEIEDMKQLDLHDLEKEITASRGENQQEQDDDDKPGRKRSRRRRARDAARSKSSKSESESNGSSNGTGLTKDQRNELKAACVALPDPTQAQEALRSRFGIEKISEISANQFEEAKAFLENIARGEGHAGDEEEEDPFFN